MEDKALLTNITDPSFIEVCQSLQESVTWIALSATQRVGMNKKGSEKVADAGRQTETARKQRMGEKGLRGKIRARREDVIEREMNERAR